jgi:hypothetical protein
MSSAFPDSGCRSSGHFGSLTRSVRSSRPGVAGAQLGALRRSRRSDTGPAADISSFRSSSADIEVRILEVASGLVNVMESNSSNNLAFPPKIDASVSLEVPGLPSIDTSGQDTRSPYALPDFTPTRVSSGPAGIPSLRISTSSNDFVDP